MADSALLGGHGLWVAHGFAHVSWPCGYWLCLWELDPSRRHDCGAPLCADLGYGAPLLELLWNLGGPVMLMMMMVVG